MLSTSALTWAAAQLNVPVYELIRSLSPTDERRIEAAYAEWRRRAAAGERRHKVDWRTFPVPEAEVVSSEADHASTPTTANEAADEPVPTSIEGVEAEEVDEPAPAESEDATDADPDVADAVEQIMAVEEPEYISLDDFNLEPSEDEMKAMEKAMTDLSSDVEEDQEAPVEDEGDISLAEAMGDAMPVETVTEDATPVEAVEVTTPTEETEEQPLPIEQRIDKLSRDATPALYEDILVSLGGDVDTLKAVTEAVIKDHTRRHRGTAAQRAFLAWLNER